MPDRIVICHRSCFQQTVIVYCQSSTLHLRFAVNAPAVVMAHLTVGIFLLRACFSICLCIDKELKIEIEIEKRNRRVLHILIFGCDSRAVRCLSFLVREMQKEGAVVWIAASMRLDLLATSGWRTQRRTYRTILSWFGQATRHTNWFQLNSMVSVHTAPFCSTRPGLARSVQESFWNRVIFNNYSNYMSIKIKQWKTVVAAQRRTKLVKWRRRVRRRSREAKKIYNSNEI